MIDKINSQILNELQDDFPLREQPYEVIAKKLDISVEELWESIQNLLEDGIIRRIGASIDSNKFGFSSTLVAICVKPEQVNHASEVIAGFPEITHSYLRKDIYNIWFTVIAIDNDKIEEILEEIRISLSLKESDMLNLPVKRLFKLDARFYN